MDTDKVFHMKEGCGDTSYSQNSSLQKRAADKVKHITAEALAGLMRERRPKSLGMADLGCSSGPNTLSNIKHLLRVLDRSCSDKSCSDSTVEFRVYLNDLPTNDFNTVFQALPDFYRELGPRPGPVYVAAYPGSFYGRLFPDHSLHFVYSSNSLHWLSRVPPGLYDENGSSINKKSIYITKRSPPAVIRAYSKQFQEDFSLFLSSRSEEVITGGRMVIILLGATTSHHLDRADSFFWDILYQSFATLVAQGEVEEEKLDSYEVHFYAPSKEELEDAVRKDGCFKMEVADMFETEKDRGSYPSYGTAVAKTVRSIQESMIAHHFGDAILDKLFDHYARMIDEELAKDDIKTMTTVLVLTKL